MINEMQAVPYTHIVHPMKRVCWTAIFIGALVSMGLAVLLAMFSTIIGLSAFNLSEDGKIALAIGGLVGLLIGVICSTLVGGYAAGYLGRLYSPQRNLGILYGFTTWTVALLLSAVFAGHVSSYLTMYSNTVSNSVFVVPENKAHATEQVVVETTPTSMDKQQTTVTIAATPKSLIWGAASVFFLFFMGAFSSCLGASWGMSCKRND